MRKLIFAATATIALVAAGGAALSSANAASGSSLKTTVDGLNLVERAQFIFGGHKHCWYDDGWHGPGWYWCGYGHRRDHGWGGPEGYQGWRR